MGGFIEESIRVGHFLASSSVPSNSSPWFTSQMGHGEGWGYLGVVSIEPSDQGAPEVERESSEALREGEWSRAWRLGHDNDGREGL
jgi:hypothetical protein